MARLTVVAVSSAPKQGPAHELGAGELSIGRTPENDLSFPDERMSRRHARVCRRGAGYVLIDCGSLKGSLVNGERVAGERALRDGDRIRLGGTELLFEDPPPAPRRACTICGAGLEAEARFCPGCGKPVAAATPVAPVAIPKTVFSPAPVPPAASGVSPTPASTTRAPGPRRSRGGLMALLVVVLVLGAGLGGFFIWRWRAAGRGGMASAPSSEGVATGTVILPSSIAPAGLRVLAPREEVPLQEGKKFTVKASALGGQPPFIALAGATGSPLLLGEAGADLSAQSTALALVLLDAEVARRGRAAVRAKAQADPRLRELSGLVERALVERPAEPLGGEASDGIYRLAAAITRDALGGLEAGQTQHAADPAAGPMFEEHAGPAGRDILAGRAAAGRPPATSPPFSVEDDPGHKTDDVEVVNGTFCYYRVTVSRDGKEVADLKRVLLLRNKPYTFMRFSWPPVGKFETRRALAVGTGRLAFRFEKDTDLTIIDVLASAVALPLGSSGLPQLGAEEDIRILMATLGQLFVVVKDFKVMIEQFRITGTPAEVAKALATFVATRATTITLAFAPLLAREFKEHYVQVLGKAVAKKLIFAITAGYSGTDMLAALFALARQPDQATLSGEQRFGVWPPVDLTVNVREKKNAADATGRLFAVAAQLANVPADFTALELRFSYPGDPEEDKQEMDPKVGLLAAREHRFIKATEAVVAAHLPDGGKLVAKGAAALGAAQTSTDTFDFERAGWQGTGRITIVDNKIEGKHQGKHKLAPHSTELSLEGTFDPQTMKGSGSIRGGDTMSFMGRAIKTAWEGTFEAELKGDRLEIRFSGKFTQGGGPFARGMSLPPSMIVARGVVRSP